MSSKPLLRYTISGGHHVGFQIFKCSVKSIQKLLGDAVEIVICYNKLGPARLKYLENLGVRLVDQSAHVDSLSAKPRGPAWKIYPPRLDIDRHEIFIDNDLILTAVPGAVQRFMDFRDRYFITTAIRRNYGVHNSFVASGMSVNSGLFGLPPGFDFGAEIEKIITQSGSIWSGHFDEQGAVASILLSQIRCEVIPFAEVTAILPPMDYQRGTCGTHFVGANAGVDGMWNRYLSDQSLMG